MKKIIFAFLALIFIMSLPFGIFAASVEPDLYEGNDANPNDYMPPTGCVRTTLPNSAIVGTHVYIFNEFGQIDNNGTNTLTIDVGIEEGTEYTQVLSWTWDGAYPLFAIIVKGGPAFNLYEYDGAYTTDTNLVSPINASGHPADISHVSVVLCPTNQPVPPINPECFFCLVAICILLSLILTVEILCCFCRKHKHCRC